MNVLYIVQTIQLHLLHAYVIAYPAYSERIRKHMLHD